MFQGSTGSFLFRIWRLYIDGFKDLSHWGRQVWIIILIKLFVLFVIFRLILMPDLLKKNFSNDKERSQHVLENLTTSNF